MLGYMTATAAKAAGYTNHGSYYGIPTWMGDIDTGCPLVAAKWAPLDFLMMAASVIEGLLFPLVHGADAEPVFALKVGQGIK